MDAIFYIAGAVAIFSTIMMLSRLNAVHALLYLIVSLLAVALIFYVVGAPFVAALEVIIYAGAIMVLFVFVVMMLNLGDAAVETERRMLAPGMWIGPAILAAILIFELFYLVFRTNYENLGAMPVGPKQVGTVLFGPYALGVELASLLLMAGIVGAYHIGQHGQEKREVRNDVRSDDTRFAAVGNPLRIGTDRSAHTP
jgi:NADH-quinone oxidoreductase subunit J